MPIVIALAPGVVVGTLLVSMVNSDWLKLITLRDAAAADSPAGGRLPPSNPVRAFSGLSRLAADSACSIR